MTVAQRLLFTDPLAVAAAPRSRHDDPETSRAAARRARTVQHDHHRRILAVLEQAAGTPLNAFQIAARTLWNGPAELTQVQVARRMRELLGVGLVVVDGASERGRCYRLAANGASA